jgi:hypothetical protein
VFPAVIDIRVIKTMLRESDVIELQKTPLSNNSVGRKMCGISEVLYDQLIDRLKTSRFALHVHETTDVVTVHI